MLDDTATINPFADKNRQETPQSRRPSDACMEAGKTHRFQLGQSGNPGGRPKKVREIADKALDLAEEMLEELKTIAKDKEVSRPPKTVPSFG